MNYYLFSRPSFISGVAAIIDLGNTLFIYNESPTGEVADYLAIKNDWVLVGEDFQRAIDAYQVSATESQLQLALVD